ncbi:MAG: carboxymuconolactone decarboxylase family protein [Deltaproteobacteria bacterium]|nr:carboxymuconolactone decarboxylase family protein [Deltaproteobacteria bacterium]
MGRLPELDENKLSTEQRKIYDEIKSLRGQVRGPFAVWLRNAELGAGTLKLQDMFAARVNLERRLVQLMILVAARSASAQYAWFIHEPHALQYGIAQDIVDAIRERRTPNFIKEDERAVYDITLELNTTQTLSAATFERGMKLFDEQRMVELVSGVGFYSMVAMTLNAFDVQVPTSSQPLK